MFANDLDKYQLSAYKHLLIAYDFYSFSNNLQPNLFLIPIDHT